jgi:uncharacterized damage-inducible protein DinB
VLGHIAVSHDDVFETIGASALGGKDVARYKRGSERLNPAEENPLQLEELLGWLDRTQEQIAAELGSMDEAALAREITRGDRTMTVGQRLFFLYFHESYHVGQAEIFRQLAGKADKII